MITKRILHNMGINDICERYGIESHSLEEIRTELKRMLKDNHPDNNSDYDVDYFTKLKSDLEFVESLLNSSGTTLVPMNEVIKTLAEILQVPTKKEENQKEKLEIELSTSVDNQISTVTKRWRIPRYSSTSILAIITFLWMFPNQVLEHPLMKMLFRYKNADDYIMVITLMWIYMLGVTSFLWLTSVRYERIEKEIIDRVKLDSVQNNIFMKFLDNVSPKTQFTKQEFMEYLSNGLNVVDKKKVGASFIKHFRLQEEVIQNMAEIILLRAKEYEIIKVIKPNGLIECYEVIIDEMDLTAGESKAEDGN